MAHCCLINKTFVLAWTPEPPSSIIDAEISKEKGKDHPSKAEKFLIEVGGCYVKLYSVAENGKTLILGHILQPNIEIEDMNHGINKEHH